MKKMKSYEKYNENKEGGGRDEVDDLLGQKNKSIHKKKHYLE